jgi:hypothetical protein
MIRGDPWIVFRIERRLGTANTNDFVLLLLNSARARKLAAWTAEAESRTFSLTLPHEFASGTSAVSAVNGDGSPAKVIREQNRLELELAPLPKYILLRP